MFQSPFEPRPQVVQFKRMFAGETGEHLPAFVGHVQNRASPVLGIGLARQETFADGAIHQFDRAVVPQAKAFGGVGDGDRRALDAPATCRRSWCCCGCRPTSKAADSLKWMKRRNS